MTRRCIHIESLTRVSNERSRRSWVFVTGGRIERHAQLSPLPLQSFCLLSPVQTHFPQPPQHDNPHGNPSLETPPNFRAAGFAPIRRALIIQNQTDGNELDNESAAKQLLDVWEDNRQSRQMAWEEAAAEVERERAEAEAEKLREEDETRKAEKKTKFPPLVPGMPPPKGSGFHPTS